MKVHDTDPITDQTTGQRTDHRPNHIMLSGHIVGHRSLDKLEDRSKAQLLYIQVRGLTFGYKMDGQVQGSGNKNEKWHGPRKEKLVDQGVKRH